MLPDRVSNPGPLTYESGALPIALRGPAEHERSFITSGPGPATSSSAAKAQDSPSILWAQMGQGLQRCR